VRAGRDQDRHEHAHGDEDTRYLLPSRRVVDKLTAAVRSPLGRVLAAMVGIGLIGYVVQAAGVETVGAAIRRAAWYFPPVIAAQLVMVAFEVLALRSLYGDEASKIPASALARAGLIAYAVNALVPAGRAVAEVTRAALLSRYTSPTRASVSAWQMQGTLLVGNALISVMCGLAIFALGAPAVLRVGIVLNALVTLGIGGGMLLVGRTARLGERVRKEHGKEFDRLLRSEPMIKPAALGWALMGRLAQVAQNAILLAAVGGVVTVGRAFASEGIHVVGSSAGDLVPAQLGATEANYDLSARVLGIDKGGAISIALVMHVAQLALAAIGLLLPLVWKPPERDKVDA
jgi:hypothetical protein